MDLVGFLYGFGVLQSVVMAGILLFARSGHRQANGFMAGLVLVIALSLLQNWLIRLGFYLHHPAWGLMIPPLDFTWGPLLYLYAYSLTNQRLDGLQSLHFIPTVLLMIASLTFFTYPHEQQRDLLSYVWSQRTDIQLQQQVIATTPTFWRYWIDLHLQGSFFALQFGIYCYLVLRQIRSHNQRMQQHFSSLEHINLRWLRSLTLTCLLFLALFLIFNRSQLILVGHYDVNALAPNAPYLFLVVLIYLIGIAAIFQPNIIRGIEAARDSDPNLPEEQTVAFIATKAPSSETVAEKAERPQAESAQTTEPPVEQPQEVTQAPPLSAEVEPSAPPLPTKSKTTKYERSGLSLEDAETYKIRLMHKMQEEELYLDCELTLPDLAEQTGLTPHQVSQVINGQMNQNFFSFVNNYRIQLAKKLMTEQETRNMPIVELAVEVGFKSKSSFYDAFKKATQMTPTQFKKSVQEC